jgi:hypothetical protein
MAELKPIPLSHEHPDLSGALDRRSGPVGSHRRRQQSHRRLGQRRHDQQDVAGGGR